MAHCATGLTIGRRGDNTCDEDSGEDGGEREVRVSEVEMVPICE